MTPVSHRIRYSETDLTGHLSMPGLMRLFQDLNYLEVEDAGRGIAYQSAHGAAWYMLSWDVHMIRAPKLSETVYFSCFFYQMHGALAKKYMCLKDVAGEVLAYALTRWAFVDIKTGTPTPCPNDYWGLITPDVLPTDIKPTARIRLKETQKLMPLAVTRSLIDENGHVNNVFFSELAMSLMGYETGACALQAEFIQQSHEGDMLFPVLSHGKDSSAISFLDKNGVPYANFACTGKSE